jgi:chain length determinant protein tyrosine kinase EpsG
MAPALAPQRAREARRLAQSAMSMPTASHPVAGAAGARANPVGRDAPIGDILGAARQLSAEQVERVLAYQKINGLRFGEAAIALGLVSEDEVAHALSHQFRYPFDANGRSLLHPDLVMATQPFSAHAEVVRSIRAQLKLKLAAQAQQRRALAIVSPESGDGKSYFAANLAIAFSQLGGRTLLIDADLRAPRQHELFRLSNRDGLSNMIGGRTEFQDIDAVPSLPSLFVLPVGAVPPNPLELVEGPGFARLLLDVQRQFDHVIVDTPGFHLGMDSPVIASVCGTALLVLRKRHTQLAVAQDLAAAVASGAASLAGVILNDRA